MTERTATRREASPRRATHQVDSINQNLEREWERGCFWASMAMLLVWGPLLVMHALGMF